MDDKLRAELEAYIDDYLYIEDLDFIADSERLEERSYAPVPAEDLENYIEQKRQPVLADVLFGLIDEKGVRDPDVYKRAGIDRKHFSKIRSQRTYRPGKNTVLALAFALELTHEQADALLSSAGYSLSHSSTRDLIIQFCFEKGIHDVDTVNSILEEMGEKVL